MDLKQQIEIINNSINQTKENLRPLAFNFVFWGSLIIIMSLFHFFFTSLIEFYEYSALIYWTSIPFLGFLFSLYYNIKMGHKIGFQTIIGRSLSVIWSVFFISWIVLIISSFIIKKSPVESIIFLLGVTTLTTGRIIRNVYITIGGFVLLFVYLYLLTNPNLNLLLINSVALFFGFLLPGLSLYYKR